MRRTRIPLSVSFSQSLIQRHRPSSPSLCLNLIYQLDLLYHRHNVYVRAHVNDDAGTAGDRHMVVTGRWRLFLSILGAKILSESAARMVSMESLMSMVTQHETVVTYAGNRMAACQRQGGKLRVKQGGFVTTTCRVSKIGGDDAGVGQL